jgi:hypothetical protein
LRQRRFRSREWFDDRGHIDSAGAIISNKDCLRLLDACRRLSQRRVASQSSIHERVDRRIAAGPPSRLYSFRLRPSE